MQKLIETIRKKSNKLGIIHWKTTHVLPIFKTIANYVSFFVWNMQKYKINWMDFNWNFCNLFESCLAKLFLWAWWDCGNFSKPQMKRIIVSIAKNCDHRTQKSSHCQLMTINYSTVKRIPNYNFNSKISIKLLIL